MGQMLSKACTTPSKSVTVNTTLNFVNTFYKLASHLIFKCQIKK